MRTIKQVLMDRDGISSEHADDLIQEARDQFDRYLAEGRMEDAEYICEEFFGLEPDYLDEFI